MFKWRKFLKHSIKKAISELNRLRSDADELRRMRMMEEAQKLKVEEEIISGKIDSLKNQSVWPNGDRLAFVFLNAIFFAFFCGIFPAWSPITFIGMVMLTFFKFYRGKLLKNM
jgi:hypothetical protein